MKLRNRKTGEIGKLHCDMNISPTKYGVFEDTDIRGHYWEYESLAELNADWEDYAPKEPLIKDEKVRKAVRAWSVANEIETVDYDKYWVAFSRDDKTISFKDCDKCLGFYGLEDNGTYNIDELCGEEENDTSEQKD